VTRIVLFTRGDAAFGSGHLHRASWLRETLLEQQQPGLLVETCCAASPLAEFFWEERGVPVRLDERPVAAFLDRQSQRERAAQPPLVCVLDWLDSAPEQVQALRAAGARVALLDDYGPAQSEADLVINSLLAPLAAAEGQVGRARLLSGAPYLQLPPAVTRLRGISIALHKQLAASLHSTEARASTGAGPSGPVRSIVLSFGGAPRLAQTRLALAALQQAGYAGSVSVMPAPLELRDADQPPAGEMQVRYLPADDSFHDLLAGADLALLAGGLSLYEAAFLGVPALVLPVVAHQAQTGRKLAKAGCCALAAGGEALDGTPDDGGEAGPAPAAVDALAAQLRALLADPQARGRMSAAGQQLCDGRGLLRTAELVLELAG
jgi:spore coat polysaccharide biosynthesis predicted glycosyltransferase SpsG